MKKRIISLLLALVLVFGVVGPAMGANAATKKTTSKKVVYTKLTLRDKQTTPIKFTVSAKTKVTAAKKLNGLLGIITKSGSKFKVKIDGKKATIQNKKGTIYVGKKTLVKYVKGTKTKSTKVSITYNAELKKVLKGINLAGKGNYKYSIKVGSVTIKNIKAKKGSMTMTINNAKRTVIVKKGVIYMKGDHTKSNIVKRLIKSKLVKSAKKVKLVVK